MNARFIFTAAFLSASCIFLSPAAAQTDIGGGGTFSSPQTGNNLVINSGTNIYNNYIQATDSNNSGGLFTINNGTNTYNSYVSAVGASLITGTNSGGQIVINGGTNVFDNTLTVNSGLGDSANAIFNITGGTLNQFNGAVTVNGGTTSACNGQVSFSGGVNQFYSTLTAGSSSDTTAGVGGAITISGGTYSFFGAVTAASGVTPGSITITGTAVNPVTLYGFDYSNFITAPTITGSVIMNNMTLTNQNITAGGNLTLLSNGTTGSMTVSGGSLTSTSENVSLDTGTTISGTVSLNAPNGYVALNGATVDTGADITINAVGAYLYNSIAQPLTVNAPLLAFYGSSSGTSTFTDITANSSIMRVVSGTNEFTGTISNLSSLNVQGGNNTFQTPMTLANSFSIAAGTNEFNSTLSAGASSSITGGTNTFNAAVTLSSGNASISGGTNVFSDALTLSDGIVNIAGGTNEFNDINSTVTDTTSAYYPGTVYISGGANTFNNSQLNSGMTLAGTSTFYGNVTLATDPALSEDSQLNITGNVTFTPQTGSALPLIDASNAGSINVADGAAVTLDLSQVPEGYTGSFVLIEGPVSRTGTPDSLDDSYTSLLYSWSTQWNATNFDLTVNYIKSTQQVADELGGNAPAANTLRPGYASTMFDVPTQAQAYSNVEAATGSLYGTAASANNLRLNYINQMMLMNLCSCGPEELVYEKNPNGWYDAYAPIGYIRPTLPGTTNFWFSGLGLGGVLHDNNNISGCNLSSAGFMLGVELPADYVRLGVYYGVTRTTISSISTNLESTDQNFGFYGKWSSLFLGGYSTFHFNFSFSPYEGTRLFDYNTYDSNFNAWQTSWLYEKGWNFRLYPGFILSPFAAIQYMHYHSDGFYDGDLTVSEMNLDTTRTILGIRLKQSLGTVCLHEELAYHQNFNGDQTSFSAQTGGISAQVLGESIGAAWAQFNVKIAWNLSDEFNVSGNYYLMVNDSSSVNAGMGTITLKF